MANFKFITHDNFDPYFNLASEEYLLKQTDGYYIYLWINAPAVIVGVNQNALAEVNLSYTQENGIKVVRRLTGGGAVYHDQNNLCYTVIAPYSEGENYYHKFCSPVIEYLKTLGITAEFTGRNDIVIDGKKISGNAQTVNNDRIMHHGTLLFDTDVTALEKALKPNKLKMLDKGIKSVKSRVTCVKEHLKEPLTFTEFKNGLIEFLSKDLEEYQFSEEDKRKINRLVSEKYSKYEWNIGRSPKGNNLFEKKFDFGVFSFAFDTINGKMENVSINGDFFCKRDILEFARTLNGVSFTKPELEKAFSVIGEFIPNAKGEEIVSAMF